MNNKLFSKKLFQRQQTKRQLIIDERKQSQVSFRKLCLNPCDQTESSKALKTSTDSCRGEKMRLVELKRKLHNQSPIFKEPKQGKIGVDTLTLLSLNKNQGPSNIFESLTPNVRTARDLRHELILPVQNSRNSSLGGNN